MSQKHLLVVEDDPGVGGQLVRGLRAAGFDVELATDGEQALLCLDRSVYDLMVLDMMLPGVHGLDILERTRARNGPPAIVLTAQGELPDRLKAFEAGAVDFLPKPFWMEELLARIRARLHLIVEKRRIVTWDDVVVDLDARTVTVAEQSASLTPVEFEILAVLVDRRNRAVSRDFIATHVLRGGDKITRSVDPHVARIRKKLGAAGARILSIRTLGYRLDLDDQG
jgi:DNA-binding response OmpR family regulator